MKENKEIIDISSSHIGGTREFDFIRPIFSSQWRDLRGKMAVTPSLRIGGNLGGKPHYPIFSSHRRDLQDIDILIYSTLPFELRV